ncbi:MAG: ABC transporter permease [Spirochaetota bacterium]|nr:ABC transporter permease [Spirochaetota bacterium]
MQEKLFADFIAALGRKGSDRVNYILDLCALFWKASRSLFGQNRSARKLIRINAMKQILFTGVDGLFVISIVSALLSMVIIIQANTLIPGLGGDITASLLVIIIIRELGPVLTAFIIIGRSGTAVATELGNMRISREFDALYSMGIDPVHFIVAPRLVGMIISLLLLGIYFNIIGIMGGYIAAKLQLDLAFDTFILSMLEVLSVWDIYINLVKNFFFGIVISIVCCYHGFRVRSSVTEVPQQTTKAVVNSIFLCFFFDAISAVFFYM